MLQTILSKIRAKYRNFETHLAFDIEQQIVRLKCAFEKTVVHHESPHGGEPILLLALYEKGELRPDIIKFLTAAKSKGLYVVAVNTLKLAEPQNVAEIVDCYIEKPNFGRDFGSYKTGFLHIFKNNWHENCPRLLLANDSVFYTSVHTRQFLDDMVDTDLEVLGSTENHDKEFHLGSFFVSICGSVLRKKRFVTYWHNYKLSNNRPKVIKNGEMGLTRTLKRSVSSQQHFSSLYGASAYLRRALNDTKLVDFAIRNARHCNRIPWPQYNASKILELLEGKYSISNLDKFAAKPGLKGQIINVEPKNIYLHGLDDLVKTFQSGLENGKQLDKDSINSAIVAFTAEAFYRHSAIHQNATTLLYMGVPFVKLDLVYRGLFDMKDILNISKLIEDDEAAQLSDLLLSRQFGMHALEGRKLAQFQLGLV